MNRAMFLSELEGYLMDIPKEEREEALAFYTNYFAEAGETGIGKEFQVIKELGSPKQVANMIKGDLDSGGFKEYTEKGVETPYEYDEVEGEVIVPLNEIATVEKPESKDNSKTILIIILAVFAFPLIMSVFGGVIGITFGGFGLLIGLIGGVIGFTASGVGVFFSGIVSLVTSPATGLVNMGIGLGMVVLGIVGTVLAIKLLLYVIKLLISLAQYIYNKIFDKKEV
jgi:uncharacterized membrane protein